MEYPKINIKTTDEQIVEFLTKFFLYRFLDPLAKVIKDSEFNQLLEYASKETEVPIEKIEVIIEIARKSFCATLLLIIVRDRIELLYKLRDEICKKYYPEDKAEVIKEIDNYIDRARKDLGI